jgi:putative GTP pyrophosphokinase
MEDHEKMKELERDFKIIRVEREMALNIAIARLENAVKICNREGRYNIFGTITSRIKTFESVIEKCQRRGYGLSIDDIRKKVLDIAGIRIVTPFRDDTYSVVEILHHIPGFYIIDEKDYVFSPKENGYSSYHLQTQLEISSSVNGETKLVPVEIQVRDKAMDLWATTEHIVKYKNLAASPNASEHYKRIAELLRKVDELAIELRDFGRIDIPTDE